MTKHPTSIQNFQTRQVSIFPNGLAFFHKSAQVDASTGRTEWDELPFGTKIIFGSLRFSSPANPIVRIAVSSEEVDIQTANTTLAEILSHNLDGTIQFSLKNDPSTYTGTIVSLKDEHLLVKMDKGWKQIALEAIDYLDFAENPNLFRKDQVQKTRIQLDFEQKQKSVPIDLIYVQKGISWVPNYHLELLGDHTARLSLKANVLNEAEDIQEATVHFALSVPSFYDVQEPLLSSQSLEDFLGDFARNRPYSPSYDSYDNAPMERHRAARNYPTRNDSAEDDLAAAGSLSDEDLFFYTQESLSLPKGGRMLLPLLETDIRYEDHYSTRLNKESSVHGRSRHSKRKSNTVWHSLTFKNESGLPLPTGSISFVKNEGGKISPISQNRLDFVPAGLLAGVKMTKVPDIAVFDYEKLTDVQENVQDRMHLITVEASIEASNFKKREITLEIKREVEGELLESDFPWTQNSSEDESPDARNPSNEVSWLVNLKPGEHQKIRYGYMLYISR